MYSKDWLEGYVGDVPYTANFYYQQTPDFLKFCGLLKGYDVSHLDNGFTYLELGSGMGFGLNMIAALYPTGEFYGVDFNPEHIRFSNKIKKLTGINNVTFYELSFEELLKNHLDTIPDLDFIVLHGVFSWVSDENKRLIADIIRLKLKPGGICYVSYNNMCGWWRHIPFQRFLLDYSQIFPHLNSILKIKNSLELVKKLRTIGANYFNQPFMEKVLKKAETSNPQYLVHEYLNETWRPLFFTEVLSILSGAKLNYIGCAEPIWNYPELFLNEGQIKIINEIRSNVIKEMIKDYITEISFRRDLYMKGGEYLPGDEFLSQIKNVKIYSRYMPIKDSLKIKLPYGNKNANIDEKFLERFLDKIDEEPKKISELIDENSINSPNEIRQFLRTLSLLIHGRTIDPVFESYENRDNCIALNKLVASHSRHSNILHFFSLPHNNSGIRVNLLERLVYDAVSNKKLKDLNAILEHVKRYLTKEVLGKEISDHEIEEQFSACIRDKLPAWKKLDLINENI